MAAERAGWMLIIPVDTAGLEALDAFLRERLSLSSLRSVPVHHCHNSFAVVLNFLPSGVTCCGGVGSGATKIVYSGDTRPCDTLVEAGRAADLLIHEATFDDELGQDAVDKKHSTTKEALEVGYSRSAPSLRADALLLLSGWCPNGSCSDAPDPFQPALPQDCRASVALTLLHRL